MITETVPGYKLKVFGLATNVYLCLGVTIAMVMGLWLPERSDKPGMEKTTFWRYIFATPIVFCALQFVTLFTILKYDSIVFMI